MLTERLFSSGPVLGSRARRVLSEGRDHGASAQAFERRGLVGLPIISLRGGADNADCSPGARHQLSHGGSRPKREARKSTNARTLADRWRLCGYTISSRRCQRLATENFCALS